MQISKGKEKKEHYDDIYYGTSKSVPLFYLLYIFCAFFIICFPWFSDLIDT